MSTTNGTKATTASKARECPHCHGQIETVGNNRQGQPIERCRTCGREPGESRAVAAPQSTTLIRPRFAVPLAGKPCSVGGCPGTLDDSGRCACCEKRAAYVDAHAPKRKCDICDGTIRAYSKVKYCKACKPVANKVSIVNAPSVTGATKRGAT